MSSKKGLRLSRVALVGLGLVAFGMAGFLAIDGLLDNGMKGSKLVGSFYCSVMTLTTIGFGDICPGETDLLGKLFLTLLPLLGCGFFCGPVLSSASSWRHRIPGGILSLGMFTIAMGVSALTTLEGMSISEAIHLCIITGTTVGYGNITPHSDLGRFCLALYAIATLNVMGGVLDVGRQFFEKLCLEANRDDGKETKEE